MSKVAELAYDIEQLYIEGHSPKMIAKMLECPIEMVYGWIEEQGVGADEDMDPYNTVNS
jgi:transposase